MAFLGGLLNDIPILGDIGPKLPVVGPLLFEEPGLKELQQQLAAAAQRYDQMRLPMQQARMQGLNSALGQFNPAANMLGMMYGQQFRPPTQVANPMGGMPAFSPGGRNPLPPRTDMPPMPFGGEGIV